MLMSVGLIVIALISFCLLVLKGSNQRETAEKKALVDFDKERKEKIVKCLMDAARKTPV